LSPRAGVEKARARESGSRRVFLNVFIV